MRFSEVITPQTPTLDNVTQGPLTTEPRETLMAGAPQGPPRCTPVSCVSGPTALPSPQQAPLPQDIHLAAVSPLSLLYGSLKDYFKFCFFLLVEKCYELQSGYSVGKLTVQQAYRCNCA